MRTFKNGRHVLIDPHNMSTGARYKKIIAHCALPEGYHQLLQKDCYNG